MLSLWKPFSPHPKETDLSLIQAAQRGDRAAFDGLVRTYAVPLRGFLTRRVGPDAAEDVLQETWLAGWAAIQSYHGRARFKSWLYGIALHKCQDHQRLLGRSQAEPLTEETKGLPRSPDVFAAVDQAQAVRRALANLPDAQREVLDLYFFAELTLPEIAEALGRNLNTVKYQFYRAHAQAALELQEYAPPVRTERRSEGAYSL